MSVRIASLHVYPIKSCAGIDVQTLDITAHGPQYDRQWMIVDESTKRFLSQRELPGMAMLKPQLTRSQLVLGIPQNEGMIEVSLPLENQPASVCEVEIWSDKCPAYEAAPMASEAISDFLKTRVRLVRMAVNSERRLDPKYGHPELTISFVDQMPILLMSASSVADLNSKLGVPVKVNRFRPNIVIDGAPAFEEDKWKKLQVGNVAFDVAKPCSRCIIVNTDQETGMRGPEPLKTLATYRRDPRSKVVIGQYLIHNGTGQIRVGEEIQSS